MLLRILAAAAAVLALALGLAWALSGTLPAQQAAYASAGRSPKPALRKGKAVMPVAAVSTAPAPLDLAAPKACETASFALG